jgi:predicted outer membrane repeat protein
VEINGGGLAVSAIPDTSAVIVVSNLTAAGNKAGGLGGAIYGDVGLAVSVVVGGNLTR